MNKVGRELTAPSGTPIKSLFVYNCNPAVTLPDQHRVIQGLEREDLFTVVFDQVLTDTALYADVILPATTFLEHYDYAKAYGALSLQLAKPVIEPVGESRSNNDVFLDLVRRLGLSRDGDPDAAWLLLDLDERRASFRRTPYDVARTQEAIRAAGLPPALAERLALGV